MPFNTLKTQAALLGVMVRSSAVDKKKLKTQSSEIFNLTNLGLRFSRPLCLCCCFRATNAFKNQKYFSKILIFQLMTFCFDSVILLL